MKSSILKNRTVIGIICIILAAVICFVVLPLFNNLLSAKADIVRVRSEIKRGAVITQDMVEKVTVGKYNLPADVVRNSKDVVGKYAVADLEPNDYILTSKIATELQTAEQLITSLDGKKVAMSVTLKTFANGVSGKLKGGDIVSIFIAKDTQGYIPPELKYVKVVTSTTQTGKDVDDMDLTNNNDTQNLPSTVTLLVNDYQAQLLAQFEKEGSIHIALVCRGDNTNAQSFLEEQDKYLATKTGGTN